MLNVHDHYQNMKHVISADKSNPDKALSLIKDDFFDNIKNIVLEHQQWHRDRKVCDCSFEQTHRDQMTDINRARFTMKLMKF